MSLVTVKKASVFNRTLTGFRCQLMKNLGRDVCLLVHYISENHLGGEGEVR